MSEQKQASADKTEEKPKIAKQEEKEQSTTADLRKETEPPGYDRSYAQNLYGEAQSDYLKYLSQFKDKDELLVKYQAVEPEGKTPEERKQSLLFAEAVFKDVKLVPRNYTALQYDHILNMKARLDDYLRKQTIPIRELHDRGEKLPERWETLLQDKAETETSYYRDGVRIFYNIDIDGKKKQISDLESDMLDRTNRKVAVDLAFLKSETGPKKSATS